MAGFTSMDDFVAHISGSTSSTWRADWNKNAYGTGAQAAGYWYSLFKGGGNPPQENICTNVLENTWTQLRDTTGSATGIWHSGDVLSGSGYKCIVNASAFSAAGTTMPTVFMLVDLLGFYRCGSAVINSSASRILPAATLPRYTNGAGVQAFVVCTTAPTAGGPNFSMNYTAWTSSGSIANRNTPTVPALPSFNATPTVTQIVHSGVAAGKFAPFIPLNGGESGIVSIQNFTLSGGTNFTGAGELSIFLCKPLLTLPMTTQGVAAERDLLNQIPSLPKVYDGACLAWLQYAGANTPINSSFYGHLDFAWS